MNWKALLLTFVLPGLSRGAAPAGRYIVNTDTVYDTKSGLTWQRVVDANSNTYANAAAYCDALSLAGFTDWRLPEVKELATLVDVSVVAPSIDSTAFPSTPTAPPFWSASPYASTASYVWTVEFSSGRTSYYGPMNNFRVRCVR